MTGGLSTLVRSDTPTTDIVRLADGGRVLRRSEVLARLTDSAPFRTFFAAQLVGARFDAFFWETPPWTSATLDREFEMALVEAPSLRALAPDPRPFAARFAEAPNADVLTFANLGGDAMLVVPTPRGALAPYAHLAAFVRGAPAKQVDAVLRALGAATSARVSSSPLWVSTAGLGVSWLHLRLDAQPKYYRHGPYKRA